MSQSRGFLSPIQTNFNENSLPVKHQKISMVKIVLPCYVLGRPHEITVGICDINHFNDGVTGSHQTKIQDLSISYLKKLIWNDIKESGEGSDKANELVLWKVAIPYEDNKLVALNEKFNTGEDIKHVLNELNALKMNAFALFSEYFPIDQKLPTGYIRIIAEPPRIN
ncbi:11083_t:CDS:2, partial [Racocetra persica]